VIQPNAAWADVLLNDLAAALAEVTGVAHIYANTSGRARNLEGLEGESRWLLGGVDEPVQVLMNGATYLADLTGGQKTGLFYDQRPNHAFAARLAKGRRVLDVFSHVGGFGLAALAAGASSALAVDASAGALTLAGGGATAAGFDDRFATRRGDAFDVMAALAEEGETFGLVVCDPPAFAPSKPALEAGLRAYERVAKLGSALVAPGGYLVLCSCSHAADLAKFRAACLRGIGKAGRQARIVHEGAAGPDHPVHPHLAESSYLKAIFLALD
jgi:23S rRNA (cytosine1962-C5)-methyltransferase